MLLAGDEIGRTQRGNNNAYCQDNEVSWVDWEHVDRDLLAFTRRLIRFRRDHPVFQRRRWFQGHPLHGSGVSDIGWFRPDGARDVRGGVGRRLRQVDWRVPQRQGDSEPRVRAASASSTTAST